MTATSRRGGRLHAPEIEALVGHVAGAGHTGSAAHTSGGSHAAGAAAEATIELRAPSPGVFSPRIAAGDLVSPGSALGELAVLGRVTTVVVPRTAPAGIAVRVAAIVQPVSYGESLVALDPSLQRTAGAAAGPEAATAASVGGLVFRAPTSGRFYGRSAPDKPAFVTDGASLATGATICLLEVMKTFHRVTYGGPGLPDTARVIRVLVADGDDVNAGDPLLALE